MAEYVGEVVARAVMFPGWLQYHRVATPQTHLPTRMGLLGQTSGRISSPESKRTSLPLPSQRRTISCTKTAEASL